MKNRKLIIALFFVVGIAFLVLSSLESRSEYLFASLLNFGTFYFVYVRYLKETLTENEKEEIRKNPGGSYGGGP